MIDYCFINKHTMKPLPTILLSLFLCSSAFAQEPGCENLFPDNAVILFQGDSITDGHRGRSVDPNHLLGHGYVYLIASDLSCNHPGKNWKFVNRGVAGDMVDRLQKRWEKDTIAVKPDVLSIMIGCNDFYHGVSVEEYTQRYDALLKETVEKLPNVKLIIIEPFCRADDETLKRYAPFQKAAADLAKKYNAVFVPTQQMYSEAFQSVEKPAYWLWDRVHPTTAGHWLLYKQWLKCVKEN